MIRKDFRCGVSLLVVCVNEFEEPKDIQDVAFVVWREAQFLQRAGVDDTRKSTSTVVYRLLQSSGSRNVRMSFSHACLRAICGSPGQRCSGLPTLAAFMAPVYTMPSRQGRGGGAAVRAAISGSVLPPPEATAACRRRRTDHTPYARRSSASSSGNGWKTSRIQFPCGRKRPDTRSARVRPGAGFRSSQWRHA